MQHGHNRARLLLSRFASRMILSGVILSGIGTSTLERAIAQSGSPPGVRATKLGAGVAMLEGQGGNLGVSIGADGVFLIDDQYAPMVDGIRAAIRKLGGEDVRWVLNTHWHGDHTGGNERLGVIVAHANVRKRMSVEQFIEVLGRKSPPSPKAALPVVTFDDGITFHWNGDTIRVLHVPHAHTDGDAIVYFEKANVLHMGDTFFHGMYPFIDLSSGGSLDGVIAAANRALSLVDDKTKIIPGHGKLASKPDLVAYREFLVALRTRVAKLVAAGKSLETVLDERPTKEWDATMGKGFMKPEVFTRIVYESVRASLLKSRSATSRPTKRPEKKDAEK